MSLYHKNRSISWRRSSGAFRLDLTLHGDALDELARVRNFVGALNRAVRAKAFAGSIPLLDSEVVKWALDRAAADILDRNEKTHRARFRPG